MLTAGNHALRVVFATSEPHGDAATWMRRAANVLATRGHAVTLMIPRGQVLTPADSLDVQACIGGMWDVTALRATRAALGALRPHAVFATDRRASRALVRTRALAPDCSRRLLAPAGSPPVEGAIGFQIDGSGCLDAFSPGLSVVASAPDRNATRRLLRLPRRAVLALQVAALDPGAGHELTLRALAALVKRQSSTTNVPLVVGFLGTGPEEAHLHVLAQELGLKDHVLWIGYRKDVEDYIAAADMLLVPAAHSRATTNVMLAAAHAVPAVALSNGNREAWATSIGTLVDDAAERNRLGEEARARAERRWSNMRLADELEAAIMAAALAQKGDRAAGFFVDRDGTLVHNVPYNADAAAVVLEPDAPRALGWLRQAGFAVVVVTNQSGVARGRCTLDQVHAVNDRMVALLRQAGTDVDAIYLCPHHPDFGSACECRKPAPGMLLQAARQRHLDLGRSVLVGDEETDLEAARRAGVMPFRYSGNWVEVARVVLAATWARQCS